MVPSPAAATRTPVRSARRSARRGVGRPSARCGWRSPLRLAETPSPPSSGTSWAGNVWALSAASLGSKRVSRARPGSSQGGRVFCPGAGCSQATQHCPSTGFSAIGLALRMVSGSHLFSQDRAHHLISTMSSAARWPHLLAVLLRTFLSWAWQQQGPGWGGRREPLGWTCSESSAGLQGGALETLPGV